MVDIMTWLAMENVWDMCCLSHERFNPSFLLHDISPNFAYHRICSMSNVTRVGQWMPLVEEELRG